MEKDRVQVVIKAVVWEASGQRVHGDAGQRRKEGREGGNFGCTGAIDGKDHRKRLVVFIYFALQSVEDAGRY